MALTLSGDDGVAGVNGSATTPAIQGTDTNTGLTFGTDTVNVVTGGSTRTTVDSSGRLLVGTSTAFSSVRNAYESEATPTRQTYVATATNSVNNGFGIYNFSSSGFAPNLDLCASKNNTVGSHTIVSSDQALGHINFGGSDGTQFRVGATILAAADGTPGASDMPGKLVFSTTADGASSPTERMRIASSGRLRVNLADFGSDVGTSNKGFEVNQDGIILTSQPSTATQSHHLFYNPNGNVGNIQTNGSSTSFNTSSDYRLKENVVPVADGITRLQQLNPARFNFIADPNKTVDGFLAHEVQHVVPEAISGEKDAVDDEGNPIYQGIDQSKLVPLLTAALQEAISKIEALETRVAQLEGGAS